MGKLSTCVHTAFSGGGSIRGAFGAPMALCACGGRANGVRRSCGAACPRTGVALRRVSHFISGGLLRFKIGCGHAFIKGRSISKVLIIGCRSCGGHCLGKGGGRVTNVCPRVVKASLSSSLTKARVCARQTSLVKHTACNCNGHCFVRKDFHISNSAGFRPSGQ